MMTLMSPEIDDGAGVATALSPEAAVAGAWEATGGTDGEAVPAEQPATSATVSARAANLSVLISPPSP